MTRNFLAKTALVAATAVFASPIAMACASCNCKPDAAKKPAATAATADLVDTAVSAGKFKTLVAAVQAAGLVEALKGEGPLTVLAPTDEAFAKLPEGTLETLLKPENKEQLQQILLYHVIAAKATSDVVATLTEAETLQGQKITITPHGDHIHINGSAKVVAADVMATNGVIHVIDTVLLPPAAETASADREIRERNRPEWRAGR